MKLVSTPATKPNEGKPVEIQSNDSIVSKMVYSEIVGTVDTELQESRILTISRSPIDLSANT